VFATVIPSKIFESMAMGLPMVYCGPAGEGSQIVERHAAGIYVAGGDPAALAAAVETLSRDPSELARLARNSAAAAGEYSRERQAALSLAVFERAVGGVPA
jgi:glycosyltransferase involved in cell wall biosynthesis